MFPLSAFGGRNTPPLPGTDADYNVRSVEDLYRAALRTLAAGGKVELFGTNPNDTD